MSRHLQKEIEQLKKKLLQLGGRVEGAVRDSILSLEEKDNSMAEQVKDSDLEVDQMEVEIEEDCLKILALHQPVAIDLRFIVAVLKINNDLERIGDLAVNIAGRSVDLARRPEIKIDFDFILMSNRVQQMLKESLDSLVNMDPKLAQKVRESDDRVDAMNADAFEIVQRAIETRPDQMENLIHFLSISRHLERIADHATNIAEDVIYMIEGEIVRHRPGT